LSDASPPSGTAVVRKRRSSQITGLEWPSPGTATRKRTFSPVSTFQVAGGDPLPVPFAPFPRKEDQLSDAATGRAVAAERANATVAVVIGVRKEVDIPNYDPEPMAIR